MSGRVPIPASATVMITSGGSASIHVMAAGGDEAQEKKKKRVWGEGSGGGKVGGSRGVARGVAWDADGAERKETRRARDTSVVGPPLRNVDDNWVVFTKTSCARHRSLYRK